MCESLDFTQSPWAPPNRIDPDGGPFWQPMPIFKCPSRGELDFLHTGPPGPGVPKDSPLGLHYFAVMGAKNGGTCPAPALTPLWAGAPSAAMPPTASCIFMMLPTAPSPKGGDWSAARSSFKDITDGTSKTFLISEVSWDKSLTRTWMIGATPQFAYAGRNLQESMHSFANPPDNTSSINNDISFGSTHPGGAHFGFADGSARFVSENIELDTLKAAASRADGFTTPGFD